MADPLLQADASKDNFIEQLQDLQERLAELERFALTSQDIVATSIKCSGDIYTEEWTPYQDDSTIVGWTSYTQKVIEYRKIGKLVFVNFRIAGESDSVNTSFTVPFNEGHTGDPVNTCLVEDDGTRAISYLSLTAGLASFFPAAGVGGWTNTGDKEIYGQFWYETD